MLEEVEFRPWPKIGRPKTNRITISEKMDGTNACIIIQDGLIKGVQSRNRLITPENDNAGFANYVQTNRETLITLGDGYHYGEWCGPGIQKNPHNLEQKTLYLFNTFRPVETLPVGVKMVQILYEGPHSEEEINKAYTELWESALREGYTPEGIIVYSHAIRTHFKYTYANQEGKWANGTTINLE
jgi:hypothetical protein